MKIRVTQKNIDEGNPGMKCSCPIALALSRVISERFEVHADLIQFGRIHYGIRLNDPSLDFEIDLPEVVQDFIDAFDRKEKVKPFTFELPID